jgi:hypothetical protein
MFSTQFTSGISLPNGGLLLNALCLIALLLFGPTAAMNSYRYNRIGRMMNAGGGERSNNGNQMSAFFGQSVFHSFVYLGTKGPIEKKKPSGIRVVNLLMHKMPMGCFKLLIVD